MERTLLEIKLAPYKSIGVFDSTQLGEIHRGLEAGVNVSVYADPKYNWRQMDEIRKGLESGIDVSIYADPKYSWKQMEETRLKLEGIKK